VPRVLKAHTNAVINALPEAGDHLRNGDKQQAAQVLAHAVITATDDKTQYCVIVRDHTNNAWVFGPYATASAATKAITSGNIAIAGQAGVWPLIPAPKKGWEINFHNQPKQLTGATQ
jgi:hypothetical protein